MTTQIVQNNWENSEFPSPVKSQEEGTIFRVLVAVSFCHLLNDTMQSLLPSIYPILKTAFHLNFGQIGLLTLTFQMTASVLQPFIGLFTDRKPMPYSLPLGMVFTLFGLLLLSIAPTFGLLLLAAAFIGMGSAVFHPESSRVARFASGGQHGLAQSVFQVGGNSGQALGPLLAAFIVVPHGQRGVAWFSLVALLAIVVLTRVGRWYKQRLLHLRTRPARQNDAAMRLPRWRVASAIAVLIALVFSKYFYLASFTNYYTFYLMLRFHVGVRSSQIYLFAFLAAVAAGTLIGGPVGDRIGRKTVIWISILGILPLTLLLPYANLFWTGVLSVIVGLVLASAFPAILVYAQEIVPGRVGMISGLFFGFAFGMGGIGAAILGRIADATSIPFVYKVCAYLPAIGLLAGFLPDMSKKKSDEFDIGAE
jgi:FSR family fosmidomycin resistance protein-like MFS transporter